MPFGEDLSLSAIPSIASLGAAAIQRKWALKDWNRVNEYNAPKAQIGRLKEAGLPLAAMLSGSAGASSTAPDVRATNVDPTLGTVQGLQNYFTNRIQKKQIELLDQDLRIKTAEADIKESERDFNIYQGLHEDLTPEDPRSQGGRFQHYFTSNHRQSMAYQIRTKKAQTESAEITARLQEAKTQTDIDHVLQTIRIGVQNERGQKIINDINVISLNYQEKKD